MYLKVLLLVLLAVSLAGLTQPTVKQINNKTYRIGYFASPPLSSLDDRQNPQGFIVDLLNKIAEKEHFTIEWIYDDWSHFFLRIKNNSIDLITSAGLTEERQQIMDYSKVSFATVWGQVFLSSHSSIESIFDLNGKKIGIMKEGVNGQRFISQCNQFEINCTIVELQSYEEIFKQIASGQLDAGVSNNLVGTTYLRQYDLINSAIVFNPFKVYVAAPKNSNQELLLIFDKYLQEWKNNPHSFYYETRIKWLSPQQKNDLPQIILYLLTTLVVLAGAGFLLAFFFKRQVKYRVNQLSKREMQLNQIINLVPHLIFVSNAEGQIILANKTASNYFGLSIEAFEQCNIVSLCQSNPQFKSLLKTHQTQTDNQEIISKDAQGQQHTLYLSKTPYVGSKNQQSIATIAIDISDVKHFEEKIKFMDQHDGLTQLPNRLLLKDRIDHSLAIAKRHKHNGTILFIGLDHFKTINDSQGHEIGDLLLKEVAERLKTSCKDGDTVARLGGDEFIIELSELDSSQENAHFQADQFAKYILKSLTKPYSIKGKTYHITASIGAVLYPKDGTTQAMLLQRADTAINQAKKKGRNRVEFFKAEFEYSIINKHNIESDLRKAIDEQQFFLEFQPVTNNTSQKISGTEALLRWQHPDKGVIYPNDFISIAEQTQLIVAMGDWVLEQSCRQITQWIKAGEKDFFIAVNVSVVQLRDRNFYQKCAALVQKHKIPANYLELEVTESVFMQEQDCPVNLFNKLKLLGLRISIDDFGTGHSSFNYLMNFPIDKIKIDQSFIRNLPDDRNSTTIVSSIIRMAKELGIDVVAEGVESQEQFYFLKSQACDYYQGFYFHKPATVQNWVKHSWSF